MVDDTIATGGFARADGSPLLKQRSRDAAMDYLVILHCEIDLRYSESYTACAS
jgi:hypothetical protein